MKKLIVISTFIFFMYASDSSGNEYVKWSEQILKDEASWVKSLSKNDVAKLTQTSEGYKIIVQLFSDKCDPVILSELISKKLDVNVKGEYESLGHMVIAHPESDCVAQLINNGLNPNLQTTKDKESLLQHAVKWKNKEAVKLLCQVGADPYLLDTMQMSAKLLATRVVMGEYLDQYCH
jgi:hypothetical protein